MLTDLRNSVCASRSALLLTYGIYATAVGTINFLAGGFMVFAGTAAAEGNFVGHLTQAHAGMFIGLGCLALGLRGSRVDLHSIYVSLLIANLLGFIICGVAAPVEERSPFWMFLIITQLAWVIVFLWLYHAEARFHGSTVLVRARTAELIFLLSFSGLVVVSGLVWVVAPSKFAVAAAGALAGPAATFAGQSRGAVDVSMGIIAWVAAFPDAGPLRRAITISLFVANVLLVVAGLVAQLSIIYTPARWVVEGLHVWWALGFGWAMWTSPRSRSPG